MRIVSVALAVAALCASGGDFARMKFNNDGLVVPAKGKGGLATNRLVVRDCDGDGRADLIVNGGNDGQWNGTESWLFRNPGDFFGVFDPPTLLGKGPFDDGLRPLGENGLPLETPCHFRHGVRDVERQLVDYDGDGTDDLMVSVGDWTLYGWDAAYDDRGNWTNSTLHGYIYLHRGLGGGRFAAGEVLRLADGNLLDAFGGCSALFEDWDGDGDLDLVRVDFTDTVSYFENIGTRRNPAWDGSRFVRSSDGTRLRPELCMAKAAACDVNGDGRMDIVFSEEDARPSVAVNTGHLERGVPVFDPPRHLVQKADELYLGALATPWVVDWDRDGDEDMVCGDSAGHVAFFENLSGPGVEHPKWAAPVYLCEPDGRTVLIQAGPNGSIQGPCEAKWGYTCLSVADWDGDGLPDVMANTIWGKILLWRNIGTRTSPMLDFARGVEVEWDGPQPELEWGWFKPSTTTNPREIITQWRSTPVMVDWNGDGLMDLLLIDTEGRLCFWERTKKDGELVLLPPKRSLLDENGAPIVLTGKWLDGKRGGSGRRKLCLCDWDGDGRQDLVLDGGKNVHVRLQTGSGDGVWRFGEEMPVGAELTLSGHSPQPSACDFNGDGVPDIVLGAEDGFLYYFRNPRSGKEGLISQ